MKNACAYIRVSDDRQDEYSPDSQLKLIKEYAQRNDFDIPEEYVFYDDGISGRSVKKRKAFNDMIAFVKSEEHPVDAILVWKFSRFARNQEESIVYKSMLKRINVSVISISETIDDSPFAPLIERIIEFMDEYYSTRLSQEVTRGMTEKASRGEAMSKAPFGYDNSGKTFIPNKDAKLVKWIFQQYLNGKGYRKIASELGTMGVRTSRGNMPDNRFIEYILRNPVYIGKIRWNPNGRASSSRYNRNTDNLMIVDGAHEPIIDLELFNKVQDKISDTKRKYPKYQRPEQPVDYMLKGLIRCSNCGATLIKASNENPFLQCHNYARSTCKVSHYLSLKKANALIIQTLEQCLETQQFNISIDKNETPEFVDYDILIEKEKEKIQRISDAYDAGFDTLEEYGRKKVLYQNKINELTKQKEAQQAQISQPDIASFADKARDILKAIKDPSLTEKSKNEALRSIIDHIVFNKQSYTLDIFFYT